MFKLSASAQDRPKTGWLLSGLKPGGFRISDFQIGWMSSKLTGYSATYGGHVDFGFSDWMDQLNFFGLDGSAQNWAQSWPASLPD